MKLYELPRNTKYKIVGDVEGTILLLDHIDGMYSVSYIGDEMRHISAMTDVEIVNE